MAGITGKKPEWVNCVKKVLALGAVTLVFAVVFPAAAFFYPPSHTDAVPSAGYEDAKYEDADDEAENEAGEEDAASDDERGAR